MLRSEPVRNAKHGCSRACGKNGSETFAVFKSARNIAAAVEIKHDACSLFVVGRYKHALEITEIHFFFGDVFVIGAKHKLAHFVLRRAGYTDRAGVCYGTKKTYLFFQ